MVLQESHCLGFREDRKQTATQWMDEQKIADYNVINDQMMQLIGLKNRLMPGPLDLKSGHLFYLALYDLDNFRSQIKANGLLNDFQVNSPAMEKAMEDDVALLELGMKWVKKVLFNQI